MPGGNTAANSAGSNSASGNAAGGNQASASGTFGVFQPQHALFYHLPIESKLTELWKPKNTDSGAESEETLIEEEDLYYSRDMPYTYEKGSLSQQKQEQQEPKTKKRSVNEVVPIRMDEEYYAIDVIFEVAVTKHNFERGNLFIQSEFSSFRKGVKPIVVARTGFMDPKGSFTLLFKEMI